MTRRVVITGLGTVCPVGNDMPTAWRNLVAGESGARWITRFDHDGFKHPIAAEVRDFSAEGVVGVKALKHMDLNVQYAVVAALESVADAGLELTEENRDRVGVIFGSGGGGLETVLHWHRVLDAKGPRRLSPFFMSNMVVDAASGHIAIATGAGGPNYSPSSACATGANAVADAALHIRAGKADAIIAGGSEAVILPLFHGCFEAMRVLATPLEPPESSCKPFDRERTGFIPGEGGAALVVEELEHAQARGARIYAEVVGTGSANDAHDMAQPEPHGRGLLTSMEQALAEACLPRTDVGYVNLHGTATQLGDRVEIAALHETFGGHANDMLVSSIKAATGHMMGASGALEVSVCALALQTGVIPPTLNYETPDPDCDIDCVPNEARHVQLDAAMSTSVGLGGHNAAVLLKRWVG